MKSRSRLSFRAAQTRRNLSIDAWITQTKLGVPAGTGK
jgi:hypothetical protein